MRMYLEFGKSTGSRLKSRLLESLESLVQAALVVLHLADAAHQSTRVTMSAKKSFSDGKIRGISYVRDGKNHYEVQHGKTEGEEVVKTVTNIDCCE